MSIEEKYDEVKQLIAIGKEKGYLLYDEVNELLPADITSSDELDDLFSTFGSAGIEVVDSEKTYREEKLLDRTGEGAEELELDLTPGRPPRGSLPRDPLDVLQLLELFEPLNCPFDVTLAAPLAADAAMSLATVETLIASPSVRAVYWDVWSAQQAHSATPGAQLYPASIDRPALGWFREIRANWLR